MRQPISFIHRNLVFRDNPDDVWAVYRLATRSYAGLSVGGKREVLSALAALASGLEAEFSLLRVARPWDVEQYLLGVLTASEVRYLRREPLDRYLERQRLELSGRSAHAPEVYLSVRLDAAPAGSSPTFANLPSVRAARRALGRAVGRAVSDLRVAEVLAEEEVVRQRVRECVDAERAATHELQWLIRRAFTRGLSDPVVDERFLPQALIIDAASEDGIPRYRPLKADLLRLLDSPINVEGRKLRIENESGESHQAFLCLGALPEAAQFPGRQAELLFAPLESLAFPVDAAFTARPVRGVEAMRMVRRRILGAGTTHGEDVGSAADLAGSDDRPREVRELEARLRDTHSPPLLLATVSLALGAPAADELEERVQRLRREYEWVELHRPLGEQLGLFIAHLPGQHVPVEGYEDYLTAEQFGAMVPVATHAVGNGTGPCIGFALTGTRQPVLFDVTARSRSDRPRMTLFAGTLGSGKTLGMQLIMYQAFLAGSMICDIDPRGEHVLGRLPGVTDELEVVELSADERYRGLLDPLRIAPAEMREGLACQFLASILPAPIGPTWEFEIRDAVRNVVALDGCCCGEVVEELKHGSADGRVIARALTTHSSSGLAKLGLGEVGKKVTDVGTSQVTTLRIRDLPLPLPGVSGSQRLAEERFSRAILHLLAVYALNLTSADRSRHAVLSFDDAWALLGDSSGRGLVDRMSRLGHSHNLTPLLATRVLGDLDELEKMVGAAFCFGVETEREASVALRLLGLDEDDAAMRRQLASFRCGSCLMRDYEGRSSPIQIDIIDPELLAALEAAPRRGGDSEHGPANANVPANLYELHPRQD